MRLKTLRYLLTATCRDASRVASDECDGPVGAVDRWAAWLHRVACGPCRRSRRQLRLVDRLVRCAPPEVRERFAREETADGLSDAARERIHAALRAARENGPS